MADSTFFPRAAPPLQGMPPIEVAKGLLHHSGLVFFDSAGNFPSGEQRPISVIAARPSEVLRGNLTSSVDRQRLRAAQQPSICLSTPDFPQGGLCGWVDYEGDFVFGNYPEMLVYCHTEKTWWETGRLSETLRPVDSETAEIGAFSAQTSREEFVQGVNRIKEWIAAGDIYQVNLTQAFTAEVCGGSLFSLYEILRETSPGPMAAYFNLDGREILSSSPETFLKISDRNIETRPIKGTRPRFPNPEEDQRSARELQTSAKEIAELVMITDLLRNDLGQVCEFGSVQVAEMLSLETLAQVHHLVSTVTGKLRPEIDAIDALAACFPGGSITGAPKKRAMEIIAELEKQPRGIYCGAIGWLGNHGESAFNIVIRTLVRKENQLIYQTGAGIVADSDPEKEYEETLHKAAGIRLAIERWKK